MSPVLPDVLTKSIVSGYIFHIHQIFGITHKLEDTNTKSSLFYL